ncbi:MAG: hypothetical protein E6R08_11230 [Nevskiaceae bacterium]|nr:MAG: hypothetical protein E6R08_11230 [Nevskiaceae bacterium]
MARVTAATYSPEMQVITLKRDFPAFSDPENLVGFTTPEQIAMFTHEWIHYLHNVSTLLGLTTFCNLTMIWSNFRWSFGPSGWSESKIMLDDVTAQNIEQQYQIMQTLRGRSISSLPDYAELEFCCFTGADLKLVDTSHPVALHQIKCSIQYGNPTGVEFERYEATIGVHEILECAAFLLEERASIALGALSPRPSLDPYLLVVGVARYIAPGLDREDVLRAAIASLQHPDPPKALKELLETGESASKHGHDPKQAIQDLGMRMLDEFWDSAEETLQLIEGLFPLDEPMGRVVKLTTSRMQANMLRRRSEFFFELDIIEKLRNGPACLEEAIRLYGAPILIQERNGYDREDGTDRDLCRDVMYDFANQDATLQPLSDGWRLMHAAYKFVGAHFRDGRLLSTESAVAKCPFYATCDNKYRKINPKHCGNQPWLAVADDPLTCDYAFAVHITRPPSNKET